jgi:two-component system chemotaxis response regulator CheB
MLSAYTQKGAEITMKALEMGALDFIPKPSGEISLDLYHFKEEIISKIKIVAGVDVDNYLSSFRGIPVIEEALSLEKVVVIGASTGGPKTIVDIMHRIPSNLNASFLIVQHMPEGFTKSFAERISWQSDIKTKEAEDGDWVLRGAGYVAPAGFHMLIEKAVLDDKDRFRIRLDETPLVNYVRPSVDVTMASASELFGENTIGVILTGMGKDGVEGARKIKEKGGYIIAQDESTSVVYGMPREVTKANLVDKIAKLSEIPEEIMKRLG